MIFMKIFVHSIVQNLFFPLLSKAKKSNLNNKITDKSKDISIGICVGTGMGKCRNSSHRWEI